MTVDTADAARFVTVCPQCGQAVQAMISNRRIRMHTTPDGQHCRGSRTYIARHPADPNRPESRWPPTGAPIARRGTLPPLVPDTSRSIEHDAMVCPACGRSVLVSATGRLFRHRRSLHPGTEHCPGSHGFLADLGWPAQLADEFVLFAIDGGSYEIRLTAADAARLRAALAPFIAHARPLEAS